MRVFPGLLALLAVSACIDMGGRTGPGQIPRDATGAMYTDLPAEQIAACIAAAIGGRAEPAGDRFVVTSPVAGVAAYDVGANVAGGDYPVQAIIRGRLSPVHEQRAAACLATGARPS